MTVRVAKGKRFIEADPAKCAGCITCMLHCSFRSGNKFSLSASCIKVERLVGRPNEFDVSFNADCDACLICARYCPYGALTASKEAVEI
ncbi:MAG: 4Fe-4S binding protein [Dehalococcoidia bacterium]|nr:4Fe-4S binding protein [Dehalococcoidia bacterium]